jgi:hypothetical protein
MDGTLHVAGSSTRAQAVTRDIGERDVTAVLARVEGRLDGSATLLIIDEGWSAFNVGSGTPRTVGEMAKRWRRR